MQNQSGFISTRFLSLRGGRMTKWKGRAASYAPRNGPLSASVAAMSALMLAAPLAFAEEECGADLPGADSVTCGNAEYPDGILYVNSDGLTLTLDNQGMIIGPTGSRGVSVSGLSSSPFVINALNFEEVTTEGNNSHGIANR